jgi:hypothetical protein
MIDSSQILSMMGELTTAQLSSTAEARDLESVVPSESQGEAPPAPAPPPASPAAVLPSAEDLSAQLASAIAQMRSDTRANNEVYLRKLGLWAFIGWSAALIFASGVAVKGHVSFANGLSPQIPGQNRALVMTSVIFWLTTVALIALLKRSGGIRRFLIGQDGRFSTGRLPAALWTVAIGYGLLFLGLAVPWSCAPGARCPLESAFSGLDSTYLVLLGGPFAASIAAAGIVGYKISNGTVQQADATSVALADFVSDNDGKADLVDAQYLLFNVVALAIFIVTFISDPTSFPTLPTAIAMLPGLGALTYGVNKAVAQNRPVIMAVTRLGGVGPVTAGLLAEVSGTNLVPTGARSADKLALVSFSWTSIDDASKTASSSVAVDPAQDNASAYNGQAWSEITRLKTVPPLGLSGLYDVSVSTYGAATSAPCRVRIEAPSS